MVRARSRVVGAVLSVALLIGSSLPFETARAAPARQAATDTLAGVPEPDALASLQDDRTAAVPTPGDGEAPVVGKRATTVRRGGRTLDTVVFAHEAAPDGLPMRAGSFLVKFRPDAAPAARDLRHRAVSAAAVDATGLPDVVRVQVHPGDAARAMAAYRGQPDVEYVEPDYAVRASFAANDTRVGEQWGLTRINAPQAWDLSRSDPSIRIAILDCGIYSRSSQFGPGHADVRDQVVLERDFTSSPFGPDDFCDHGTHVAGIAAAATNNGIGVAGVGFNATILNGKVLDDEGNSSTSIVTQGITWAADNGARVINLSLGGYAPCGPTMQAAVDYAWARNAVIVAAAGNDGRAETGSPANCSNVVGVAATDQADGRASFSNYGPDVDVAAPGVTILSTDFVGGYYSYSGTSQATPHVAGLAALVWATNPSMGNQAVVDRIQNTADRITGTGTSWTYGRVNARTAVTTDVNPPASCPNPSSRPPVRVVVTPVTSDQLSVAVTAGQGFLRAIDLGHATNASVDLAGSTGLTGNASPSLPALQTATTFTVRRAGPGAVTVPLTVHDDCGAWPTFVGRG